MRSNTGRSLFRWSLSTVAHNRVIGYIIFWVIGEEAQINNIAVHPGFRRLGVGERVLRQVIAQLRSSGVSMVTLEVRPSNTGAQTLYRKLGFRMIGLRKGYYTNPPEDAFVLALHL